jgi:hypothetical protein
MRRVDTNTVIVTLGLLDWLRIFHLSNLYDNANKWYMLHKEGGTSTSKSTGPPTVCECRRIIDTIIEQHNWCVPIWKPTINQCTVLSIQLLQWTMLHVNKRSGCMSSFIPWIIYITNIPLMPKLPISLVSRCYSNRNSLLYCYLDNLPVIFNDIECDSHVYIHSTDNANARNI